MKTLKLAFVALLAIGLSSVTVKAQDASKSKASTKTTTKKTDAAPASTTTSGQHLKKDGTPDMRFKENKDAAKSGGTTSKPTAAKSSSAKTKTGTKTGGTGAKK